MVHKVVQKNLHTACVEHNPSQEMETNVSSNMQPIAIGSRGRPSAVTPMSGSMK